jgi:hypothetical protein
MANSGSTLSTKQKAHPKAQMIFILLISSRSSTHPLLF